MSAEFNVETRELTLKIEFTHAVSTYAQLKDAAGRLKQFLFDDPVLNLGDKYLLVSEGDGCGD